MPPTSAINNGSSSSASSAAFASTNGHGHGHGSRHGDAYSAPSAHDDADELDLLGDDDNDDDDDDAHPANGANGPAAVLRDDPLHADLSSPLSFKRKQKQPGFLSRPARLISALTGGAINPSSSSSSSSAAAPRGSHDIPLPPASTADPGTRLDPLSGQNTTTTNNNNNNNNKDTLPLDWHVEGPGRRVGYEDLTAIDWIFEYTKERQRQRALHSPSAASASSPASSALLPLLRYIQRLLDASQVWVVLVLTGVAVGSLAAGIDVATDWLGDVKDGFCSDSGPDGGAFYLSRSACCLGYDETSQCAGWRTWGAALGASSAGAVWAVEYVVYSLLAVGRLACVGGSGSWADDGVRARSCLRSRRPCWSRSMPSTPCTAGYPRSRRCWAGLSSGGFWASGR